MQQMDRYIMMLDDLTFVSRRGGIILQMLDFLFVVLLWFHIVMSVIIFVSGRIADQSKYIIYDILYDYC